MNKKNVKTALFPGSFDPFTLGHRNVVDKFLTTFPDWNITIGIGVSQSKKALLPFDARKRAIDGDLSDYGSRVSTVKIDNLTTTTARQLGISCLVRGLRNTQDFEYEKQIHFGNKFLFPEIETLFLMTDSKYSFISSSLVREILEHGGNVNGLVSPIVSKEIQESI